jgi:predicted nucleic acid-binding protein
VSFVVPDTDVASGAFRGTLPGRLHARLAGQRGRLRPANDTWIAACCLANELPLATVNTKDFADFAAFDGLGLIDVT